MKCHPPHQPTVAIVCHDTGAALALASFSSSQYGGTFRLVPVCSGPARKVFQDAGIAAGRDVNDELSNAAAGDLIEKIRPDAVLFGTSFNSLTDRRMCRAAQDRDIYTLGLIDWWSNFGRRFSTPGTDDLAYLPDSIAVPDEDALQGCLADGLPSEVLVITGNPYWDHLYDKSRDTLENMKSEVRNHLDINDGTELGLIISSNLRNLGLGLGYDEVDFFRSVIPLPERTGSGNPIEWIVKPHPKESPAELKELFDGMGVRLRLLENFTALEATAAADMVLGMCSSALLEAAILGRTIVSLQPGLDESKMQYLRILDRLGIPKIIRAEDAHTAIVNLAKGHVQSPDLASLPFSIGCGHASSNIAKIIRNGIRARAEYQYPSSQVR